MASNDGQNGQYKVIGTRPIRHDGTDKITGRAVYGGDVRLPGMLYGAVLRSPHAHARIRSINTTKAEALEGVRAVVTAGDLPQIKGDEIVDMGEGAATLKYVRDNVMASDKALYKGHAAGGHRQRHLPRRRRPPERAAHAARPGARRPSEEGGG